MFPLTANSLLQIFLGFALGLKVIVAFGDFSVLIAILNVKLLESPDSNVFERCYSDLSEQYEQK